MHDYTLGVIHYRDVDAVRRLLTSMNAWERLPTTVLIADNSTDLPQQVLDAVPRGVAARIIPMGGNLGYAGAANELLLEAEKSSEAFLLLTQDAELEPGTSRLLVEALSADERTAVVAPLLLFSKERSRIFSAGGVITRHGRTLHPQQGDTYLPTNNTGEYTKEVDWADGACLMLRTRAVREVGYLDAGFFLYVEEVDLQFRLRSAGWRVLVVAEAIAYQQPGPYSLYYKYRNLTRFTRRHRNQLRPWPWLIALPKDSLRMIRQRRFSEPFWAVRGLLDSVRGVTGPQPGGVHKRAPGSRTTGALPPSVLLVVETPPESAPPGVRRRFDHITSWLDEQGITFTTRVLLDRRALEDGKWSRFRAVLQQTTTVSDQARANETIMVVGIGAVHMLFLASSLARAGRPVWYDACDSWLMQTKSRLRTRRVATVIPAALGAAVQLMSPRMMAVSYIHDRDRRLDRVLNSGRTVVVIPPALPEGLVGVDSMKDARPERAVVSADFTAFHNAEGARLIVERWPEVRGKAGDVELHLYGLGLGDEPPVAGVRHIGWAAHLADIYHGPTVVLISNIGGSGVPNKLLDAVAAQRPMVLHRSMRRFLDPHPWLFYYSSAEEFSPACARAFSGTYTFDPSSPISLREGVVADH